MKQNKNKPENKSNSAVEARVSLQGAGMDCKYIFHFGKHKGKTFKQVVDESVEYIWWMWENNEWFKKNIFESLSDSDRKYMFEKRQEQNEDWLCKIDAYNVNRRCVKW